MTVTSVSVDSRRINIESFFIRGLFFKGLFAHLVRLLSSFFFHRVFAPDRYQQECLKCAFGELCKYVGCRALLIVCICPSVYTSGLVMCSLLNRNVLLGRREEMSL